MSTREEIEAALEAVLFVAGEPAAEDRLLSLFDGADRELAREALASLRERYAPAPSRGLVIEEVAGGLRIVTAPEYHPFLRKFFDSAGGNKLSMAAIETLAIVGYRQPVTAPEVNELRSKQSQAVLKNLLDRRLVRISGRREVVGRPFLYSTTREFLMHFGLRSLADLPPLEEFEETFGGEAAEGSPPVTDANDGHDMNEAKMVNPASIAQIANIADEASAAIAEDREAEEAMVLAAEEPEPS